MVTATAARTTTVRARTPAAATAWVAEAAEHLTGPAEAEGHRGRVGGPNPRSVSSGTRLTTTA